MLRNSFFYPLFNSFCVYTWMGIGGFREEHPEGQIVNFLQVNFYEIIALLPKFSQNLANNCHLQVKLYVQKSVYLLSFGLIVDISG